jgi:hypothetical protein
MTLTRKILAALLGLTVGTLAVAAAALYPMVQHHAQQLVGARFEDSLVPTARAIDNMLLDALRGMHLNVNDLVIRSGTPEQMTRQLRTITYIYPYLQRVYLADERGKIIASSDSFDVGHSVLERQDILAVHFAAAKQRPVGAIQFAVFDRHVRPGDPVFHLLAVVHDTEGRERGVLIADLLNAPIEDMLRAVDGDLFSSQQAYLLDSHGRVLLSSGPVDAEQLRATLTANQALDNQLEGHGAGWMVLDHGATGGGGVHELAGVRRESRRRLERRDDRAVRGCGRTGAQDVRTGGADRAARVGHQRGGGNLARAAHGAAHRQPHERRAADLRRRSVRARAGRRHGRVGAARASVQRDGEHGAGRNG